MKKGKILWLLAFIILNVTTVFSQIDTAFWFAAPWISQGHAQKTPLALRIATFGNPTTVRVRQPAGTFDTTYVVPANTIFSQSLNHLVNVIENIPADVVHNRGLKISSNFPITVVYDNITVTNNPETYSMKGQNALGTEFVCPFQRYGDNGNYTPTPKSQILIVATDNGTVVWITPKCNVVGHPANITYSVGLNYGQSYNVENVTRFTSVAGQNLGGTIVVSNKPIAVTVADDSVAGVSGCFDLMGDQLVPVDILGTDYIINKGGLNAAQYEGAYVVGTENFTKITIDDGAVTTTTINKGETYFYKTTNPLTSVVSDKNVYVMHTSGFGCELGEAILPPLNCAGSNQVAFTRNNGQAFYLNILCKNGAQNTFTLNGSTTLVPGSAFTVVPGGGGYVGAQIQFNTTDIPVGSAQLLSNNTDVFALGIFHGGSSSGCLYHYMSSFLRRVTTLAGPDVNFCTGTSPVINLNGNVFGATTTGSWSAVNGTGTFGSVTSLTTSYTMSGADQTQDTIKLVLTSTGNCTPIRDTMFIFVRKSPTVSVSGGTTQCKNNTSPIPIAGTVTDALGVIWTGGTGSYGNTSALSTTYTPSPGDLSVGSITLTLTSTGNLYGCPNTSDFLVINFTEPPVTLAGSDMNVCSNSPTVSLSGTVIGTPKGIWTTNGTGDFIPDDSTYVTNYVLSPSDLTLSTIKIKLTSKYNGLCLAVSDSITITIIQKPTVIAGTDGTICASAGFIPVNGTVSGSSTSGVWTTLGTGSFSNPNLLSTTYSMSAADTLAGVVKFVLTSSGGACPPVTDTVTYSILKAPTVFAGTDLNVCRNAIIPLNGLVSGFTNTGMWTSTGTGTFFPNNTALNGSYYPSPFDILNGSVKIALESTNNNGCSAVRDSITVTFIPAPQAGFTNSVACVNQPITFMDNSIPASGGSISLYNWDFGDGIGTSISQDPIYSFSIANTYTVTHWVTSSNGCTDTIRKVVEVNSVPVANFYTGSICEKLPSQFFDSSYVIPGNIVQWSWNFADGGTDLVNKNPIHTFTTQGLYNVSLVVTSNKGCSASIVKPIIVRERPKANFGMTNNPTLAQETVYFQDFSLPEPIMKWYWDFGDSTSSNEQHPNHFYNNQGNFTISLTVTDQYGCTDTIKKDISVTLLPQVPTAFTPNSDGYNDLLFVKGGPFEKMFFRVYNGWGELLFETVEQTIGWDGTFKGKPCPVGVYIWVLDVDLYNNKSVRKTGDVTILR